MGIPQRHLPQLYIEASLDKLAGWCPSEAATLEEHRKEIVHHIMAGTEPSPECRLRSVSRVYRPRSKSMELAPLTPSQEAMSALVADAIAFVVGLFGLEFSEHDSLTRAVSLELGNTKLQKLEAWQKHHVAIAKCRKSSDAKFSAEALYSLIEQIWNIGGFKAACGVLRGEPNWWRWATRSVTMVAQCSVWFHVGDCPAFIAEALPKMANAELLARSLEQLELSGPSSRRERVKKTFKQLPKRLMSGIKTN